MYRGISLPGLRSCNEHGSDTVRAQVVSGIGVLCAGAIMKKDTAAITGLTTAAGLWCLAYIGLAAGSGSIISAAWTTVLMLLVLRVLRCLEKRRGRK